MVHVHSVMVGMLAAQFAAAQAETRAAPTCLVTCNVETGIEEGVPFWATVSIDGGRKGELVSLEIERKSGEDWVDLGSCKDPWNGCLSGGGKACGGTPQWGHACVLEEGQRRVDLLVSASIVVWNPGQWRCRAKVGQTGMKPSTEGSWVEFTVAAVPETRAFVDDALKSFGPTRTLQQSMNCVALDAVYDGSWEPFGVSIKLGLFRGHDSVRSAMDGLVWSKASPKWRAYCALRAAQVVAAAAHDLTSDRRAGAAHRIAAWLAVTETLTGPWTDALRWQRMMSEAFAGHPSKATVDQVVASGVADRWGSAVRDHLTRLAARVTR